MKRRAVVGAIVGLGLSLGWSTAASASYDPLAIAISTSGCSVPGGSLTVAGTNFATGESVTFTLNGVTYSTNTGSASSGSANSFTTTVTIPVGTPPGTYTIVATGAQGDSASTPTTIATASCATTGLAFTPSPSGLAFTGADIAALSSVGAIALALGGMLILTGRRRRSTGV